MANRILIALGGNALKLNQDNNRTENQFRQYDVVCQQIVKIIKKLEKDDRIIITHGNGPQIGNIMMLQEGMKDVIPTHSMDVIGAMTQGQIGYMLQQTLQNHLKDEGLTMPVCSIINQVLVEENDPEFLDENASKPVGFFLTKYEAKQLKEVHPEYIIKKVKPCNDKAWRRCVPSPNPLENIEGEIIKKMVDVGIIVIASGGGGIPVVLSKANYYKGVYAVIDKDLAGELLAEIVGANIFLILTDVEKVKLNYAKPGERNINRLSTKDARKYLQKGEFLQGSMQPKIFACVKFLEWGGERAVITSLDKAADALQGNTGTILYRS